MPVRIMESPHAECMKSEPRSPVCTILDSLKNTLLELPFHLLACLVRGRLAVEGHEVAEIELGEL